MEDPQDLVPERKINTTEEETTWLRVREDAAARLRAATVSLQPRRLLACVKFVYAQEELAKPIRTNARKSSRKTWCQDELGTFQAPDYLFLIFLVVLAMCGIYYIHEIP